MAIRFYSREEAQEDAKKRLIEETGAKGSFANVNARRWTLGSVFVNFEPFCGNTKPVESPESRGDPPTRSATSVGQVGNWWQV